MPIRLWPQAWPIPFNASIYVSGASLVRARSSEEISHLRIHANCSPSSADLESRSPRSGKLERFLDIPAMFYHELGVDFMGMTTKSRKPFSARKGEDSVLNTDYSSYPSSGCAADSDRICERAVGSPYYHEARSHHEYQG